MTKTLSLLALLFLAPALHAQTSISGVVLDSNKTAILFCALGLVNAKDSTIIKGNLTDEDGKFLFESLKPGNYRIKINHVGFNGFWSAPIHLDSLQHLKLNPFIINGSNVQLKNVDVIAVKDPIEFKNGNIVVNVEGSPLAVGNSAYELLSRLPGVMIDNETISLQGKSGVKIYIDDRQQQMSGAQLINFLKSLNASNIEKIEVIANPGSKYDAAGNAGIINIKTKKIKLTGFSGSTNLTYSQGYFENSNGSFSLNYKGKKFAVFSSASGSQGQKHNISTFDKTVNYDGLSTTLNQRGIDNYDNRSGVIELGADWYLNKKNTIGFKVQGMPGYGINRYTDQTLLSNSSSGYDQLNFQKSLPNDWYMANYNFNAEHIFDTLGSKLKFSTDYYGPYFDNYEGKLQNQYLTSGTTNTRNALNLISNNNLDFRLLSSKLDLEKKFKSGLAIDAGVKASKTDISSDYLLQRQNAFSGLYTTDSSFTNKFIYHEQIVAGYATVSKEIKKINFQLGLRAENTAIQTESKTNSIHYTRNYFNIFPNGSLDYNHSKNHKFSINYNKRIDRPDYNSYNPYRSFINILSTNVGNPYLQPAYSHNAGLNYVYKSSIYQSLTYTYIKNPIMGYTAQNDSTKETIRHASNLNSLNILRYSFFMRKNLTKWWVLSCNIGAYYIDYSGKINGLDYYLSAIPHYEWLNNMFILPKNYKIEVTGFYWGPWLGIASKYKARGGVNLGLKKSFQDNRFNLAISLNDIFFTETFRSTANFQNQNWQAFESNDTRRLNISFSYNFGKIKVEQRQFESSEDEKRRMNK